ncbi:DUF3068 domain-containing protein [Rudaeicoccus suwonensis]|uniref:DUF3068 family protein n=1 Tax=Rudaeicoccus suwonensis TaxID=657409 RepID=A0A561EAK7_9MICO|nr:DUF3068 domain-containing protein [Rudaeicoccus suwonensis]TWE12641.1 DUF3068 family protein [Rudaeicoccus suwonensis]
MRKSAIVIGFGAFFVTMALLLKFYAYPNLAVIPKDQNTGQTLSDPDAYFFNANTLKFNRGELVTKLAVVVNKELTKKAGGNTLVIDQWQYSNTPGDAAAGKPPMEAYHAQFAINRKTGLPVKYADDNQDNIPTTHEGYTIKFPFGLKKNKSYAYWDTTLEKAIPLKYSGTQTIDGMETYKYTVDIPTTVYEKYEVPGFLFGLGQSSPGQNADRTYANQRTIWADPVTGVFMKVQENQTQTVEIPGHAPVTVLKTDTVMDPSTVKANVDEYKTKATQLKALIAAPVILGILGVLLIVGGIVWAVMAAGRRPEDDADGGGVSLRKNDDTFVEET